jgi:hypothetical protein
VAVYGVNLIDDESKSKARLEKFFINNPMPYPTIMLDKNRYSSLDLVYPTFIILDEHLEVVFYDNSYNENLEAEVTAFLESHLQR